MLSSIRIAARMCGTLVEHHAVGTLRHRGVADFGARGLAFLGFLFQDLCRPHDGHLRSFAKPEDFFLQFGKALPTTFDCEVASRDHDGGRVATHGRQQ